GGVHHAWWAAQIDVVVANISNERLESASDKGIFIATGWPDEVAHVRASPFRDRIELRSEDDVEVGVCPIDQGEFAAVRMHGLEERAQRRHANPARKQEHLAASAPLFGKGAVRALSEDAGALA